MRKLSIVLGDYPHTEPLRDGRVTSDLIELEFVHYDTVSDSFDAMVQDQAFDVGEMAVGAFMQGRAAGKPIALLPVVAVGGFHHGRLFYWAESGQVGSADLAGNALAIRSYSQTTGLWIRGILEEQYGVDLSALRWVTLEGSHAAEYHDPPNVTRAPEGSTLMSLLRGGDVVAAALGRAGAQGTATVIADVQDAEDAWFKANRTVGINHMVCVKQEIADDEQLTLELYRMLCAAHELALGPQDQRSMRPGIPGVVREGVDRVRPALEIAARYATHQGLVSEQPDVDSLFPAYLVQKETR
jgi:4,5-dihydroxyphthalate decarboxylase